MNKGRNTKELSLNEKRRQEVFNEKSEDLKNKGYEEHKLTVNVFVGNIVAFLVALPFMAILVLLYYVVNGGLDFGKAPQASVLIIVFIINLLFFNTIHEWIHGITYAILTENHFKDVEFGFILKAFTPYCVCLQPLKKHQYLLGILMPCIILGVITSIIGAFAKIPLLFFSGLIQIWGAGGDLLIAFLILLKKSKKKESVYLDHPTEIGVVLFDK